MPVAVDAAGRARLEARWVEAHALARRRAGHAGPVTARRRAAGHAADARCASTAATGGVALARGAPGILVEHSLAEPGMNAAAPRLG